MFFFFKLTLLIDNAYSLISSLFPSYISFICSIVTAFILDMFIYEYTFCKKGSIDTKVESTIKNLQLGIDDET